MFIWLPDQNTIVNVQQILAINWYTTDDDEDEEVASIHMIGNTVVHVGSIDTGILKAAIRNLLVKTSISDCF